MNLRGTMLLCLVAVSLAGCRVTTSENHGDKDVNIKTPFGGLQVRNDPAKVVDGIGLPVYPGATIATKEKDGRQEPDTADVHLGFGDFQLRVKAATYRTPDEPAKVEAFYRKAMADAYGDVITCRHDKPIGTPTRTRMGLTCGDNDGHVNINGTGVKSRDLDLRVGSKKHQHIAGIEADGSGTKFGLVALDLPGNSHSNDDDNPEHAD